MEGYSECDERLWALCLALSLFASLVFLANARGSERKQGVRYLKTGYGRFASHRGPRHDPPRTLP